MQPMHIIGARAGSLMPYIIEQIKKIRQTGRQTILIVPEQYTLQAERDLISGLALPGLLDVEVLSPRRMLQHIRERAGAMPLEPLDERGRVMAISRALHEVKDDLRCYGGVAERAGMPTRISSLLADMEKAGMDPDQLLAHAANVTSDATRLKETDLAVIWKRYLELLEGRFADDLQQQTDAAERIVDSGILTDCCVFVYGFDVLQPTLLRLLCAAMPAAYSITVTMVMDEEEAADGRIFLAQRRSTRNLMEQLTSLQIPYSVSRLKAGDRQADRPAALDHLERHLFSRVVVPFDGATEAVTIHAAANPYEELAYAAAVLHDWHDRDGYAWDEMAVALSDAGAMPGLLSVTLRAAGIPYYLARKDTARRHSLGRMLVGCVKAATLGFASEDVLEAARSGFTLLSEEEAMRLENYAIANGIDRSKWRVPFTRGDDAEKCEKLRLRLIGPIQQLHDALLKSVNAADSVAAIYDLLEKNKVYARLARRDEELLECGMPAEASQNRQVWKVVIGLLDQLYALLGQRRAAMRELASLIEAGLQASSISALPPEPDTVMIGEVGHLMTGKLKALLLMGVQDGVTTSKLQSLISDAERSELAETIHHSVGLTQSEQSSLRLSDFYKTIALPEKALAVSYSLSAQDGTALRESMLVTTIRRLLPGCLCTGGLAIQENDARLVEPRSPQLALEGVSAQLRSLFDGKLDGLAPVWQESLRWLNDSPEWHESVARLLRDLEAGDHDEQLDPETARTLFRDDRISVSRLETYVACPYQYFMKYGLKPAEREEFTFDAAKCGDFYHSVMERFAGLAGNEPSWPDLPDEQIKSLIDRAIEPELTAWESGPLREDALGRKEGERLIQIARRSASMFCRHAKNNGFRTFAAELNFGYEDSTLPPLLLKLENGITVSLAGKIDRIDRMDDGEESFIRVIDYKSSTHDLDPEQIWYGLQLQLLLYLLAVENGMQGYTPAGAFYFKLQDPEWKLKLDGAELDEEHLKAQAEKQIAEAMRLKGVVLADVRVTGAMRAGEPDGEIAKLFNKAGKDGKAELSKSAGSAYTLDQLHAMMDHAMMKAAEFAEKMYAGQIRAVPTISGQRSPCDWCDFRAACNTDKRMAGYKENIIPKLDKQEFIQLL